MFGGRFEAETGRLDSEVRDRLREFEGVGECLVLYKYEWPTVFGRDGGSRAYWAHVRSEPEDEDHLERWIEISADDAIDLDNVLAVAPLPEVPRGA